MKSVHDRNPERLSPEAKTAANDLAVQLYGTHDYGIQAIIDLGEVLGLPYAYCAACEAQYPAIDGDCFVCGSAIVATACSSRPPSPEEVCKTILDSFGNAVYLSEEQICDLCRKALGLKPENEDTDE